MKRFAFLAVIFALLALVGAQVYKKIQEKNKPATRDGRPEAVAAEKGPTVR